MSAGRGFLLAAGLALALGGCQTLRREKPAPPPPPKPAPPLIIIKPAPPPPPPPPPKSCVPRTLAPPPRYPDTDAALRNAAGAADRYQLMAAGRILREQRLEDLERVVAGCR
jgi:hypothetical protein